MAKCGKNADDFISDLHQKTLPFFTNENKELEAFKAEKTGSDFGLLQPWEVGYWAEKLKKERYNFDDENLPMSHRATVGQWDQGFWLH